MSINYGELRDLVRVYMIGLEPELNNGKLIDKIINAKLKELYGETAMVQTVITKDSEADVSEYDLPDWVIRVKDVNYDSYRAINMTQRGVKELAGEV